MEEEELQLSLDDFPDELLLQICLDIPTLGGLISLSMTSKRLYEITLTPSIWKRQYGTHLGSIKDIKQRRDHHKEWRALVLQAAKQFRSLNSLVTRVVWACTESYHLLLSHLLVNGLEDILSYAPTTAPSNPVILSKKKMSELRAGRAGNTGIAPAHIAAQYGDITLMKYLIANEFSVYFATNMQETPLTIAVTHEQGECVQLLFDHAILTNTVDKLLGGSKARGGLHFAAANGYTEMAALVLDHTPHLLLLNETIDCTIKIGTESRTAIALTPLMAAIHGHHLETAQMFVARGASLQVEDGEGNTCMHYAVADPSTKCEAMVSWLLSIGCKAARSNQKRVTPLHKACINGLLDCVDLLLKDNEVRNAIDERTAGEVKMISRHTRQVTLGNTALHVAVLKQNYECAKRLVAAGASINSMSKWGTPLHLAILQPTTTEQQEFVKLLITKGADVNMMPNKPFSWTDNPCPTAYRRSPVLSAARNGHLHILKILTEEFNISLSEASKKGFSGSPLAAAASTGNEALVRLIISHPSFNASVHFIKADDYRSALAEAATGGHLEVAEWLLAKGHPVNGVLPGPLPGVTECPLPLVAACLTQDVKMVRLLLQHHADVNLTRNKLQVTPLMATFVQLSRDPAKTASAVEIGRLLVDQKATLNACNTQGQTILHILADACRWLGLDPKNLELVLDFAKELVARGAKPELRDKENKTAVAIVQEFDLPEEFIKAFKAALTKTVNAGGKKKGRNRRK